MEAEPAQGSAWPVLLASLQLGCRAFGGPIAHLGYFERSYVQRRRWLRPEEYAEIVALCQMLPGPTSSQVGFLVGLQRAGWRGALAAWAGFTLPSVLLMYAYFVFAPRLAGPAMHLVLQGLKWLTVAVVARAVWSMARTLCPDAPRAAIALAAAAVLSFTQSALLQVTVLALSGAAGALLCKDIRFAEPSSSPRINVRAAWAALAVALALLIGLRILALQMPHSLFALADIFYRAGALVFGGGHVVLPLLHDALTPNGWISESDFLSGYGAAQVLPGPLFSVAAYLGARCAPGGAAVLGASIGVLCLFLPGLLLAAAGRALWSRGARLPRARGACGRQRRRRGHSRGRALQPRTDRRPGGVAMTGRSYLRLVPGDVNGFLGLMVDNLSVLALLAAVLIGGYGIPASIVFGRMFPGTALGVLVGDLIYTWLALRLARRTGRNDVTAMPFGLDTPSTIGMALLVLGPAFVKFRAAGLLPADAGLETWYLGMAATATMGLVKFALAFGGRAVRRLIPQAGLLGSLAGIALMLIGFFPMVELLQAPIVGFLSLGLVLYALVANGAVPGRLPGVLFAVIVGTLVYYGLGHWGIAGMHLAEPAAPTLRLALPQINAGILHGFTKIADTLPLIIPFALLTVVGGVNNAESARVAGDDYDVRSILLAEAAATLVAGLTGGVAQTTPYIGHPAYKHMGARAGYTWLTGVFIGVGGMLGYLSNLIELIPLPVLAPVLVFLALNITVQAFSAVPLRHAPAVAICFFPSIARLLTIELSDPTFIAPERFAHLMNLAEHGLPVMAVIVALGNGFIITATVWAAFVVEMIEQRLRAAAAYLAVGAVLCCFGIIHSVRADGSAYLPWQLEGMARNVAVQFSAAYCVLAAALLLLSLQPAKNGSRRNGADDWIS